MTPPLDAPTASADLGRAPQRLIVAGAALLVLQQVLSLGERNPLTDTLSSYSHAAQGWMFSLALLLVGGGIIFLVLQLSRRNPRLTIAVPLLGTAGLSAVLAAAFPADPADATAALATGQIHLWACIVLLVGAPLGVLCLLGSELFRPTERRAQWLLVGTAAASGAMFVVSQTLKWSTAAPDGGTNSVPLLGGLTQRILVTAVIVSVLVIARALRRAPEDHKSQQEIACQELRSRIPIPANR